MKDLDTESNLILKYVLEDSVGYMHMVQDKEEWRDLVNTIINFGLKINNWSTLPAEKLLLSY